MQLSVVINTKNAATYLPQCLKSVKNIADEIVVVDMASTDKTLAIATKFGARIFQYPQPDVGYADPAREFAFAKARGEWIFMIDSDEELKPELATLIKAVTSGEKTSLPIAEAYFIARTNIIFDKAIANALWYPDYQLRLWRTGCIKWRPEVHSVPKILGTLGYFPATPIELAIVHHNYQTVEQFVDRSNHYTTWQAQAQLRKSPSTIGALELWQSFFAEFWRRGFAGEGLLEGSHGITLSLLQASSELQATAKVWQAQGFTWQTLSPSELKKLHSRWQKEANYWWANLLIKQSTGLAHFYWRVRRKLKI
jgi:glycosyltransferase involved in cell wall biosynthesis